MKAKISLCMVMKHCWLLKNHHPNYYFSFKHNKNLKSSKSQPLSQNKINIQKLRRCWRLRANFPLSFRAIVSSWGRTSKVNTVNSYKYTITIDSICYHTEMKLSSSSYARWIGKYWLLGTEPTRTKTLWKSAGSIPTPTTTVSSLKRLSTPILKVISSTNILIGLWNAFVISMNTIENP